MHDLFDAILDDAVSPSAGISNRGSAVHEKVRLWMLDSPTEGPCNVSKFSFKNEQVHTDKPVIAPTSVPMDCNLKYENGLTDRPVTAQPVPPFLPTLVLPTSRPPSHYGTAGPMSPSTKPALLLHCPGVHPVIRLHHQVQVPVLSQHHTGTAKFSPSSHPVDTGPSCWVSLLCSPSTGPSAVSASVAECSGRHGFPPSSSPSSARPLSPTSEGEKVSQ
jgi:hypothetical protein